MQRGYSNTSFKNLYVKEERRKKNSRNTLILERKVYKSGNIMQTFFKIEFFQTSFRERKRQRRLLHTVQLAFTEEHLKEHP